MTVDWSVLGAPLLVGLLVVATHVLFGRRVIERGIIFIDLSIAQVAALGVLLAHDVGLPGHGWSTQLSAAGAALAAAALLAWTERRFPQVQEAVIGSLYVLAACVAILVVAHNPHGAEHFEELLAGQILWVGFHEVIPIAALYACVLAAWFAGARRHSAGFYVLFALTVTASVQLVGVFLVFASLILPALATHGLTERRGLPLGYAIGVAGYALGLGLSVPLDLPTGPLIVCTLAVLSLVAAIGRRALARR